MAYAGYLIKVGSWTFPTKYIRYDTYKITPNQRIDLDSTVTTNGDLWRQVLPHTRTKIEFDMPMMTMSDQVTIMTNLRAAWSANGTTLQRECQVTYYDMETDSYKTMNCYMPDIDWKIRNVKDTSPYEINYDETRLAFIEK